MKLKELESHLQQVATFESPKLHLEQYITTAHLASRIIFTAEQTYGDISERAVCDLGVGTGMLSGACALMDAAYVLGVDIDADALATCRHNLSELLDTDSSSNSTVVDLMQADCKQLLLLLNAAEHNKSGSPLAKRFDTVVMNPPFGTKNQRAADSALGIDMLFVQLATRLSMRAIYSIHKSCTRAFVKSTAAKWGLRTEVVSELRYNIPKIDTRNRRLEHDAPQKDVAVDLIRFTFV